MRAVKENANAKINLFLDVSAKRPDGYHDINTVMHSISLSDTLTVSVTSARATSVTLKVEGNDRLVTDDKNLAVLAAKLYLERTAKTAYGQIKLVKNIPVAAGLAGGSTDAAATLRAMNKLFGHYLSSRALADLALELGSDVPYCLLGGTALCEGRGEIINPIYNPHFYTAVAVADEYVSTPLAYAALDRLYSDFDGSVVGRGKELYRNMICSLQNKSPDLGAVYNVFEEAVFDSCPKSRIIKSDMYSLGALTAAMSGSGPSVFGIFNSKSAAEFATLELKAKGFRAWFAESV